MLVIGGRDMKAGAVSVHLHHGGPQGAKPNAEVVAEFWPASKSGGRSGVRWQAVCDTQIDSLRYGAGGLTLNSRR